jgi:hypothetical protein
MKNKIAIILVLFIIPLGCFFSCKENQIPKETNENIFLMKINSAPSNIFSKENLPEWLIIKIDEIEHTHSNDITIVNVRIFKGNWKTQVVYYIKNTLKSCLLCDVFYEDGEKIIFSGEAEMIDDFYITSECWEVIYEFGKGMY